MKKIYSLLGICLWLAACAGTPPTWWNPRSMPAGISVSGNSKTAAAVKRENRFTPSQMDLTAEELLVVHEDEYEEMAITPLQDEEQENATGETTAQIMEAAEGELVPSILSE